MIIEGRIKVISAEMQISASFKKRELVVTTDEQYPQTLMIEFTQDKCDLLNSYRPGEMVKVSINLRGREWVNPQGESKYFNSIQGWRIEKHVAQGPEMADPRANSAVDNYQSNAMPTATAAQAFPAVDDEHDDLPF